MERRHLHAVTAYGLVVVDGDPRLLDSLMTNLIDNAIRHNIDGGQLVVTTATRETGQVRLSVSNLGPVISPDQLGRLFQPFQRLGADRISGSDGHGIGLAVVQAIAVAHGAKINAVARPEGGLDIDIDFPAIPTLK
jgi:signal transduction histidine kinase